jgi:hypothetical protein
LEKSLLDVGMPPMQFVSDLISESGVGSHIYSLRSEDFKFGQKIGKMQKREKMTRVKNARHTR